MTSKHEASLSNHSSVLIIILHPLVLPLLLLATIDFPFYVTLTCYILLYSHILSIKSTRFAPVPC